MVAMANHSHICIVVDDDGLERFGSAVRRLCVGLVDEAVRTTVVGPSSSRIGSLEIGPVRVETYTPLTWWRRSREMVRLIDRLSGDPPDVVHALSGGSAWLAAQLAGALDVPLIASATGRDELNEETDPIFRSAATIVAVSDPIRTEALQRLERSDEDVVRVRWGQTCTDEPSCFLDEGKHATLVAISPLVADSGLEHMIDAVGELGRRNHPAILFVLGAGPAESQLRRRVTGLGLNERVTFAGPVREWSSVLQGADVFVLPAPQHRLSIHPIAAMAAGVVVVAADGGDHDCLIDGQTARIYHPPSTELLAAVLAEALSDRHGSRRLAASAQDYVRQNHRVSAMVAETMHLYRRFTLSQQTIPMPTAEDSDAAE